MQNNKALDTKKVKGTRLKKSLTVFACLLVQLCAGILYLWSAFSARVKSDYNWSGDSSLVASCMVFAFVSGNLLGGILQDKTNPRLTAAVGSIMFCSGVLLTSLLTDSTINLIYLTYSTLSGLGCGIIYASALSCIQRWFPTKRGFASGIAVASFGLSTVIFAPLIKALLKEFSHVSTVFRILGIAFLVVAGIACIFITLPPAQAAKSELTGLTPKQAVKKIPFWCIALTCFFANAMWNIIMPDIITLGISRGLSESVATVTLMIAGAANVLGRFSMASLSDKIGREKSIITTSVITFICAILLIWTKAPDGLYIVLVALAAFAYGGPSATLPAMCADTCGVRYNGTNYGIALLGLGLSSIVFKSLSTAIENAANGNPFPHTLSFILAAVTAIIPILLMWVYNRTTKKQKNFA